MTCREVAEFLMQYLDGELPAAQREAFDRHIAVCPDCQRYLATYRTTIEAERAAFSNDERDAPEELMRAILKARNAPKL